MDKNGPKIEEDYIKIKQGTKEVKKEFESEKVKEEEKEKEDEKEKTEIKKKRKKKSFRKIQPEKRPDLKRKILKSNMCKFLIINLNKKVKNANLSKKFKKLPQYETSNVSIKENKKMLSMALREMLIMTFDSLPHKKEDLIKNKKGVEHNKQILNFLESEKNKEIYDKLNLETILNKKMEEILKEYLLSKEFQDSIKKLKNKKQPYAFIHYYIKTSKNFIEYYQSKPKNDN